MGLSTKEMNHGAVLYQVVSNPKFSLKLIERDVQKHRGGMYEVYSNTKEYVLFVKSTSKINKGRRNNYSSFTFSTDDIHHLQRDGNNKLLKHDDNKKLLICLVYHNEHICVLTEEDMNELGLLKSNGSCGVSVNWRKGSELTVKCKRSELSRKVSRNALKNFKW